jgi:NAD-dependent SIR2 family protein deacetylase
MNDRLRELRDRLLSAKSVSVLTGAGISAERRYPNVSQRRQASTLAEL